MVDVSVGENYGIDGLGGALERQVVALLDILRALVEAAVDVDAKTVMFDQRARAGHETGCAQKLHAHRVFRCYLRQVLRSYAALRIRYC